MATPTLADLRRFERFVSPEPNSGCWLFTGTGTQDGYCYFNYGGSLPKGVMLGAHRFAFSVWREPIPDGMHVLHRCDVRCCVNPDHLFLGTAEDNMRDMVSKGRHRLTNRPLANSLKSSCRHGHPLSGDNLWIRKDGSRICKACRARIARNWRKSQ
jgi:HNH endonuclease